MTHLYSIKKLQVKKKQKRHRPKNDHKFCTESVSNLAVCSLQKTPGSPHLYSFSGVPNPPWPCFSSA
jgi:hypothetical protein